MTRNEKKRLLRGIYIKSIVLLGVLVYIFAAYKVGKNATIEAQPVPETDYTKIVYIEPCTITPEEPDPRYGFTETDIYILAQLLCGGKNTDGDGEYDIDFAKDINYYEVSKVLGVVMNRVRSDEFPNTVYQVALDRNQFSVMPSNACKTPSDIALKTVKDWCDAYDRYDIGIQAIPEDHLYFHGNGITNTTRANY